MTRRSAWIALVSCVAMLGVAAPAHAAAGPATNDRAASTSAVISLTHPLLAGRVHLAQNLSAAAAASTPVPANSCYTYDTSDGTGDTTGGLDAVDYQLSSTCGSWVATITASRPFTDSQLGAFEVDFDTDNNLSDGCDGFDTAIVAEPLSSVSIVAAQFFFDGCTPEQGGSLEVSRPTPQSVSIAFSDFGDETPAGRFRSVAFLTGSTNPKPSDLDRVPNSGLVTSQRSMSSAFDMESAGAPRLNHVYTQVVSGDFNGDGYEDVLYYAAGGQSSIQYGRSGAGPVSAPIRIWGTYHLVAGDFNGDGITDLLLYAPGSAPMRSGTGRDRTPSRRSRTRSTAATRSSPPISTATAPTTSSSTRPGPPPITSGSDRAVARSTRRLRRRSTTRTESPRATSTAMVSVTSCCTRPGPRPTT